MGKFYDVVHGSNLTVAELDRCGIEGRHILGSEGFGYACPKYGKLKGGWASMVVGKKGMGNYGTSVLVPLTERTRAIYKQGLIQRAIDSGLPEEFCQSFCKSSTQYKWEVLPQLVKVLSSKEAVHAYLDYRGYGPGAGRSEWSKKFGDLVADGLTAPRQESLAALVKECWLP